MISALPTSEGNGYPHPADELIAAMERLYHYSMTTTSGGNLSILEAGGALIIGRTILDAFDQLKVLEQLPKQSLMPALLDRSNP